VQSRGGDFQCVLVGSGMDSGNAYLLALVKDFNLVNKVRMAGARNDIPCVMNAIDLHVLSSIGEGFGNVTVEAMACGTPCVTTDVGGGALIVGDTGWVVPPQDARALASAIEEAMALLSQEGKYARSARCRERIEQGFGIDLMVNAYLSVWSKVRQSSSRAASSTNDISGN
jgi:glycosyltransferase involved in cell wall biosynthesis